MKLNDQPKAHGTLEILLFDEHGQLKDRRTIDNKIVQSGLNWMAARIVGAPALMSHMAVGSGAVAPALGDLALGGELGRSALTGQASANNVATYTAVFGAGVGTGAITEAGIFNAAAAGTMLNRATFAVVNKGALDTMQINWTVTQN